MSDDECAICRMKMLIPIDVPGCGHQFCFLCLKSACVDQPAPACPLCRRVVDTKIFERPKRRGLQLDMEDPEPTPGPSPSKQSKTEDGQNGASTSAKVKEEPKDEEDDKEAVRRQIQAMNAQAAAAAAAPPPPPKRYWLYQGRGGWWRFEPRLEKDVDTAFTANVGNTEIVICGNTYVIDFQQMAQFRKNNPKVLRKIKNVDANGLASERVKGIAGMEIM